MTWPALLFWVLIITGLWVRGPFLLYLFFSAGAFGGLSLLPPGIIGNVPLTTLCAAALIGKTFAGRQRFNVLLGLALDGRKLGILTIFCAYMLLTAFIYPRLLAGQVQLFSLNLAGNIMFLAPSSANITQPTYMLISILIAFVFADQGRDPAFREHFLRASLFGSLVLLATGVIDSVFGDIGREDLLLPFHNATYHLLNTVSIAGQKRVVGFMPEASGFGAACCGQLSLLVLNRKFYPGILRSWVIPLVSLGLIYMIYASTSSGGYVGIAVLAAIIAVRFVLHLAVAKDLTATHLRQTFLVGTGIALAAMAIPFVPHSVVQHVQLLLDDVLFDKSASASYVERSAWTHAGIHAFFATHGIGVGVGSIRTSNWFVNFAASTGVVGILLFGSFVLWMLLPSRSFPDAQSRQFATGLKLSLIPGTIVRALSDTTPDPGVDTMLVLGLIFALKQNPALPRLRDSKTAGPQPRTQNHLSPGGTATPAQ